jgi:hypothetical protein
MITSSVGRLMGFDREDLRGAFWVMRTGFAALAMAE